MADIVLPDVHYLERMTPLVYQHLASGDSRHAAYGAKPVVQSSIEGPVPGEPYVDAMQIYLELLRRADRLPHFNEAFNNIAKMREPYRLDPDGSYSYFEICDRWLRNTLGDDKGPRLAPQRRALDRGQDRPAEVPPAVLRCQGSGLLRVHGRQAKHEPRAHRRRSWASRGRPTTTSRCPTGSRDRRTSVPRPYDLFVTNMKVPNHALSHTHKNSILSTLSNRHNDLKSVWINPKTAEPPGASPTATWWRSRRLRGPQARRPPPGSRSSSTPRCWPPRAAAAAGASGSSGDEVNFNALLNIDVEHIDFVSGALDCAIAADVRTVSCRPGTVHDDPVGHGDRRGPLRRAARPAPWPARPRTSRRWTPGTRRSWSGRRASSPTPPSTTCRCCATTARTPPA